MRRGGWGGNEINVGSGSEKVNLKSEACFLQNNSAVGYTVLTFITFVAVYRVFLLFIFTANDLQNEEVRIAGRKC